MRATGPGEADDPKGPNPFWVEVLTEFLRDESRVEAVRFNDSKRSLSMATLQEVDEALLAEKLRAAIRLAEKRQKERPAPFQVERSPSGIILKSEGDSAELAKPTCPTAPRFWRWREFAWPEDERRGWFAEEWKLLATLSGVCAATGLSAWILSFVEAVPYTVSVLLYMIALAAGAWDAAIDAFALLRERKVDIHFLMLAVAVGASLIGAYGEAALLLFLFSASGAMEAFAEARTQKEIRSLFHLAPRQALRIAEDGTESWTEVDRLTPGDNIRVRPGDAFPVDGVIADGETEADESALTGESLPVRKSRDAGVFGGTLNLSGSVAVRVTKPAAESALEKIIRLIKNAQAFKAPTQRFTDKFGAGYTLAVLGAVTLMFFVWWLALSHPPFQNTDQDRSAFYLAMTLLVVASPCALVISIPSAILAAIAYGARRGILFRGGAAIENFAEVDTICFDKTGTLTTGEFEVVAVESFPAGNETGILTAAYSLEMHSRHPLARAIVRHANKLKLRQRPVESFSAWHGMGVEGKVDGITCLLGRKHLFEEADLGKVLAKAPGPEPGISEVWVLYGSHMGRLLLRDRLRPEAPGLLRTFKANGVESVMLTGDHPDTAAAYARESGLSEAYGGLLPEDKVDHVKRMTEARRKIAMVGDGVNDAPGLAAAFVSVGMGMRGSDAALEQCDFVLMSDRLEHLFTAWRLSRKARAIIRQNLIIALGTVVVMVLLAMGALVPLPVGVLAHEGSTVLVCLNSLRLLRA